MKTASEIASNAVARAVIAAATPSREEFLTKRLAERGEEVERLRSALNLIANSECQNFDAPMLRAIAAGALKSK